MKSFNWNDPDGVSEYSFYFSFDDGKTFLPVPQSDFKKNQIVYKFDSVYKNYNAKLKCVVKSIKGFEASAAS